MIKTLTPQDMLIILAIVAGFGFMKANEAQAAKECINMKTMQIILVADGMPCPYGTVEN